MQEQLRNTALAGVLAVSGAAMEVGVIHGQHEHNEPSPIPSLMPEMDHMGEHAHSEAMINPEAPVYRVEATEFSFIPEHLMVENEVFTISMHNKGVIDHDFTIEKFEDQGGIHLAPEEEGLATYFLEDGEYIYYCTLPGHRAAGMEGALIVDDVNDEHMDSMDDMEHMNDMHDGHEAEASVEPEDDHQH